MYTIANDALSVKIDSLGAELASIVNNRNGREYLWSGDPMFWGKKSPVLFPIVGTLKDNAYYYNGKKYELSRHGFAREKDFQVTDQSVSSLQLAITNDEETYKVFPFYFDFSLQYTLEANRLSVTYLIENTGSETMYFSVGGHPAFAVPLANELIYEDYYLHFNRVENAGRWPISKDGLIHPAPSHLFANTDKLSLSKELFYNDALVFKQLQSDAVVLKSDKDEASIEFSFQGFPFLGIWAAKNAPFVCIEPWCGVADPVNTNQDISTKEGIVALDAGATFKRTWSIIIT